MSAAKSKLHVFRAGKHVAASGEVAEFSAERVAAIAAAYDPKVYKAPFVIGHPKTDDPAFGWVGALQADGGNLFAEEDTEQPALPEFKEMVNAGRFRNISVAIWPKGHPSSPKPEGDYLKHVGFLGATAPAVKGLTPAHFKENDDKILVVEFGEEDENAILEKLKNILFPNSKTKRLQPAHFEENKMSMTQAELDAREAALKIREDKIKAEEATFAENQKKAEREGVTAKAREEATAFAEKVAKEGRILPAQKAGLIETLVSMAFAEPVEFSEDGGKTKIKKSPADMLKDQIVALKPAINFSEKSATNGGRSGDANVAQFRAPDGMTVDNERAALNATIQNYAEAHKVTYAKAYEAVVERGATA